MKYSKYFKLCLPGFWQDFDCPNRRFILWTILTKLLFHGSYTEKGLKGFLKEGATKRREARKQLVESVGGTLEAYYFAFGDNDFYVIEEVPDNKSAAAGSLVANDSGTVKVKTVVLLTPEEVDEVAKMTVEYRPPGQ